MDIKAYESRKIVLDMLEKRNYDVDKYRNYNLSEIKIMFNEDELDMMLEKKDKSIKCYVKYHICKKCRCNDLKKIVLNLYPEVLDKDDELIIICKEKVQITNTKDNLKKTINHFWDKHNYYIQLFQIDALMIDITQHKLVPVHTILTDSEVKEVLKRYNTTIDKLPIISKYDPVSKVIGLRPGQVCQILRRSITAGDDIYYRRCE